MKYNTIVVGGTFDLLHEGHKAFLRYAFSLAEMVYVTITSDRYTKEHKPNTSPFALREENVRKFLQEEDLLLRAQIFPIDSVFGIAERKDIPLEAIVVTDDTYKGAEAVNKKRKEVGLPPLRIEVMDRIAGTGGILLSSTYTRFTQHVFHMPSMLRTLLHQPFGKIIPEINLGELSGKKLIAVGDVTTKVLHQHALSPIICVIDFTVERKKQNPNLKMLGFTGKEEIINITNPPSTLTPALWEAVVHVLQSASEGEKSAIIIDGEEDLAVLPLLFLASEEFVICYGQPHEGMVVVPVTSDTKKHALELLTAFVPTNTRGH